MKIYFCGSITGGRVDLDIYKEIVSFLKNIGTVLTEHIIFDEKVLLTDDGKFLENNSHITENYIYERDMKWIKESDVVIAEVSTPSLGVGYELKTAEELGKPIICFFKKNDGKGIERKLSPLIKGNKSLKIIEYENMPQIKEHIKVFLSESGANS